MRSDQVIVYSIDDFPSFNYMAQRSIESVRAHGSVTPIVIVAPQSAPIRRTAFSGVEYLDAEWPPGNVFMARWAYLARLEFARVLHLDADTVAHFNVDLLFDRYREHHVYAREDIGAGRIADPSNLQSDPQILWSDFDEQRAEVGARDVPVFNAGIVLFNCSTHRKLLDVLPVMHSVVAAWTSGARAFPCKNPHILDQLALSLGLGLVDQLTCDRLCPSDAPFFQEWQRAGGAPSGLMHIFTALYHTYLCGVDPAAAEAYRALRNDDLRLRAELARRGVIARRPLPVAAG